MSGPPAMTDVYLRQREEAEDLMRRYLDYARSIGCTVTGDLVECSAQKALVLAEWWRVNTERPRG